MRDLAKILRCPVSKQPLERSGDTLVSPAGLSYPDGDFRVDLSWAGLWEEGQSEYEQWMTDWLEKMDRVEGFADAVDAEVAPIYETIKLTGAVLDVGGEFGTVVQQAGIASEDYLSVDPLVIDVARVRREFPSYAARYDRALACDRVLGVAEFLPLADASFDTVHMRSCIDHFASPRHALLEAFRVLRPGGKLVVGVLIEGLGRRREPLPGEVADVEPRAEDLSRRDRTLLRWRAQEPRSYHLARRVARFLRPAQAPTEHAHDHHMFHPTRDGLIELIASAGFHVVQEFWQPAYEGVLYVEAVRNESVSVISHRA